MAVSAISELAVRDELSDVREQFIYTVIEVTNMQGPNSRSVHDPSATGYGVQRAGRCGVAAFGVLFADFPGSLR